MKIKKLRKEFFKLIWLFCAAHLVLVSRVHAQLEEVVVTAQKREQSLQDAPIAITAFGQHELEQKGIRDLMDLEPTVASI